MVQVLDCGNLDISKLSEDVVTADQSAWVAADVDEKIYLYSSDYNNANEPVYAYMAIRFASPCVATICDSTSAKGLLWALSTQEAAFRNRENFRNFAINQTSQLNDRIKNQLTVFGVPSNSPNHASPAWGMQRAIPILNDEIRQYLTDQANKGLDVHNLNDFGFQSIAVRPLGVVIPIRHNFDTYGPWVSNNFNLSAGGITVTVDNTLAPWNFGSSTALNAAGENIVEFSNKGLTKAESGSVTLVGIPSSTHNLPTLGSKVSGFGPNLTSINFSLGTKGATTTYEFKTYTPKFGKLTKLFYDRYKEINKGRNKQLRLLKDFQAKQNKLYRKIAARRSREKIDTMKADALSNSMQRVIVGHMQDWYEIDGDITQKSVVGLTTLAKTSLTLENYSAKGMMSLDGIFSPATFNPNSNSLPRVAQSNSDEPINTETYNPFSKGDHPYSAGRAAGHSIDLIGGKTSIGNGLLHSFYDYRDPNKYPAEDYNFIALRGPLMLHSWGYDTKGKPVPNAGGDSDNFASNWLQKPRDWPVAPIDLRFDSNRGVWTTPEPPTVYIAKLSSSLSPFGTATASANIDGETKWITITDFIGKTIKAGALCYVYYHKPSSTYIILEYQEFEEDEPETPEEITVVTDVFWDTTTDMDTGDSVDAIKYTTKIIKAIVLRDGEDGVVITTTTCPPSGTG